jgi:hypothetical protein
MSDLNDLNKPDGTSNYSTEVMQTLRGHITRLWKGDYTGMSNLVAGMLRWSVTGTTNLSARLYQRNALGADVEVMMLSGLSIGGNAATATTATTAVTTGSGNGNIASNTANGTSALYLNSTGRLNTANGYNALAVNSTGSYNTANGYYALRENDTGICNTANGCYALAVNTTGSHNTANGYYALYVNSTGSYNTANGSWALAYNNTGSYNTANGYYALYVNSGGGNTANGYNALYSNSSGGGNTANGYNALADNDTGSYNTASGSYALRGNVTYSNVSGFGAYSQVTGSNQVQLGDSATTTYVYGTVQNRSDLRDKTDVRDSTIGLEFIEALRPVDYRWDMREFYKPEVPAQPIIERPTDEQSPTYAKDLAAYELAWADHKVLMDAWLIAVKPENLTRDGTKKRNRYHHGLIAQEVKSTIDLLGIDFGGYQDHKIEGGEDVLSIGYDELIAPLIKAVQQLSQQNKDMAARLLTLESVA